MIQILEETSSVSLHSKEIYIMEASFTPKGEGGEAGEAVQAVNMSFDLKLTTATFTFPEPLAKGKGALKLSFQCDINNQVTGRGGYEEECFSHVGLWNMLCYAMLFAIRYVLPDWCIGGTRHAQCSDVDPACECI